MCRRARPQGAPRLTLRPQQYWAGQSFVGPAGRRKRTRACGGWGRVHNFSPRTTSEGLAVQCSPWAQSWALRVLGTWAADSRGDRAQAVAAPSWSVAQGAGPGSYLRRVAGGRTAARLLGLHARTRRSSLCWGGCQGLKQKQKETASERRAELGCSHIHMPAPLQDNLSGPASGISGEHLF